MSIYKIKKILEGEKMQYIRIKQLREDKDLTQRYMANKLNMKQPQYARYESGSKPLILSNFLFILLILLETLLTTSTSLFDYS